MSELSIASIAEENRSCNTEQTVDWAPVSVLGQVFTSCEGTLCTDCPAT
jgi:hypothetical protein